MFSTFSVAKADPNIKATITGLKNPVDYCSGASVYASIAPKWVVETCAYFEILSATLYVREDLGGGVFVERVVGTVGSQPVGTNTIQFSPVYGLGLLRVAIQCSTISGSTSSTFTSNSGYGGSHYLLSAKAPAINCLSVTNALTASTNPDELAGCLASNYDLIFDIDYVYGFADNSAIKFEIFSVGSCDDNDLVEIFSDEYDEFPGSHFTYEDFLDEMNISFKDVIYNTPGFYKIKLTLVGGPCGGTVTTTICVHVTNTPSSVTFELTGCKPGPFDPITGPFSPEHIKSLAPVVGGTSVAINGNLSSGHFAYYKIKVEKELTGGGFDDVTDLAYKNTQVPVVQDPSFPAKYTNISSNVNSLIQANIPSDKVYDNPGFVYRITLTLGSDCGEVSEWSFLKTDNSCSSKSAAATKPEDAD